MRDGSDGRCGFSWNAGDNMAKQRMSTHFIGVVKIMAQTKTSGLLKHPFGVAHNTRAFSLFTLCHRAGHSSMAILHRRTEFGLVVSDVGSNLYLNSFSVSLAVDFETRQARQTPIRISNKVKTFRSLFCFVFCVQTIVWLYRYIFQRDSLHG